MAAQGILRMRRHEQAVIFQVEGRATMHHSLPLRRVAEQALADGVTALRVDLQLCTYMDSTFLGTLLFLQRAVDRAGSADFALVGPSLPCQQLIQQMGLEDVYPVLSEGPPDAVAWTVVPTQQDDAGAFNRNVVRAHQELANVPGPAGACFRPVAECLARDMPEPSDETLHIEAGKKKP